MTAMNNAASRPRVKRKASNMLYQMVRGSKPRSNYSIQSELCADTAISKDKSLAAASKRLEPNSPLNSALYTSNFTNSSGYRRDQSEQEPPIDSKNHIKTAARESHVHEVNNPLIPAGELPPSRNLNHFNRLALVKTETDLGQMGMENDQRRMLMEGSLSPETGDLTGWQLLQDGFSSGSGSSLDCSTVSTPSPDTDVASPECEVHALSVLSEQANRCSLQHPQTTSLDGGSSSAQKRAETNDTASGLRPKVEVEEEADAAPPKKRSRKSYSSDPLLGVNGQISTTANEKASDLSDPKMLRLACPFYKKDAHKYHDCLKYELRRVRDVKQHIYRRHKKPDFYCARCFETFTGDIPRDMHTREARCGIRVDPHFDGISEQDKQLLNGYASRGKTVDEHWYHMWDTIFRGEPRPRSIYIGSYREEMMTLVRLFWNERQSEILSSALENNRTTGVDPGLLCNIMGTVFDRFEAESAGSGPSPATAQATQDSAIFATSTTGDSNTVYEEGVVQESPLGNTDFTSNSIQVDLFGLPGNQEGLWTWDAEFDHNFFTDFSWDSDMALYSNENV